MDDRITNLRTSGDVERALDELLEAVREGDRTAYRRHLLGEHCLLLDWAWRTKATKFDRSRFAPLLNLAGPCANFIRPRIDVIDAVCGEYSAAEMIERLSATITAYAESWNYIPPAWIAEREQWLTAQAAEPAFLKRLNSESQSHFRHLANRFGWLHPGLLLVGATWAQVWNNTSDLPRDHEARTWGLLAKVDHRSPDGFVARLICQRVPGGCGMFYPDPMAAGYLATDARFQQSLQNAWWAVIGSQPNGCIDCDVRWSVRIVDRAENLPLDVQVEGRSMEVALACGLAAAVAGEPLDEHVAVTAKFKTNASLLTTPQWQEGSHNLALEKISGISKKFLAPEFAPAAREAQIQQVLVATNQPEVTQNGTAAPRRTKISDVTLIPITDLASVQQHAGRWSRLTQIANERLAERAGDILKLRCDPYIKPSLSREDPHRQELDTLGRPKRKPLDEEEFDRLVRGQVPRGRNRIAVLGDSGMGKSMFLVYCEQQIAKGGSMLPLRLGAGPKFAGDGLRQMEERLPLLSAIEWKGDAKEVVGNLVGAVLQTLLNDVADAETVRQWLSHLIQRGQVIFLLDAMDQTNTDLDALGTFLQRGEIAACPVLITGRPETQQTKAGIFEQAGLDVLWTDPFDEPRQRKFLGDVADDLIPETESIQQYIDNVWDGLSQEERDRQLPHMMEAYQRGNDRFVPAEQHQKSRWFDLLGIPILLHELRGLAQDGVLPELKNRENVYARSLERLIKKGLDSAKQSGSGRRSWTTETVKRRLRDVAWETILAETSSMAAGGDFTGVIVGEPFEDFKEKHEDILDALAQIDLTTLESLLDEAGYRALAWRHLSFCEYFAGVKLATVDDAQRREIVRKHAQDPRWRWIFRYALAWAERENKQAALADLADGLVRFGNPFLVYLSLRDDEVKLQSKRSFDLPKLCRWLVHRDWGFDGDFRTAWKEGEPRPAVDDDTLEILQSLFSRQFRNSRCLDAAWELLESADQPKAQQIREEFLSEAATLVGMPGPSDREPMTGAKARPPKGTTATLTFVRCPRHRSDDRTEFMMGSDATDEFARAEGDELRHPVIVSPFEMATTPITNAQYELFDPNHRFLRDRWSREDDCPAIYVNWFMAAMFCRWLGNGCRLPTEAEWEYACRAGTSTRYYAGDEESDLADVGWYHANSDGRTQPVGGKTANAWGLYDMHGNVFEWCQDWYAEYGKTLEVDPVDPVGPDEGAGRVNRGGGWGNDARYCRSAYRRRSWPENRDDYLGFRVARSPSGKTSENSQQAEPDT